MGNFKIDSLLSLPALALLLAFNPVSAQEPFKLGVQEKDYVQNNNMNGYADYPAYQSPQLSRPQAPMQGNVQAPAPMQAGLQKVVVLPPAFLGLWNVQGQRTKVEAQPEFQAGAERAFSMSTSNTWEISGNPSLGYAMGSNSGVKTPLIVDKVQGETAFIRYQHPVGNTMAQEAIVMNLLSGGAQFKGLERVSIVKQGLPPRARVTYQLTGLRQR